MIVVLCLVGGLLGVAVLCAVAGCLLGRDHELFDACFPPLEDDQALRRAVPLSDVMAELGLTDGDLISPASAWSDDEQAWAAELSEVSGGGVRD